MAVTKILAFLVVVGTCVYSSLACGRGSGAGSNCNGLDCPRYTVQETGEDYEMRMYPASVWVSTRIVGMDYNAAGREGFNRLFAYISGANELGQKIDMTAPVTNKAIPGSGSAWEQDFTVSFFLPFADESEAPQPSESNVFITTMPQHEAYVRIFSGYAGHEEYSEEANTLAQALDDNSASYHGDFLYTAGYDAPFKPFNRRNEVWYFKADE